MRIPKAERESISDLARFLLLLPDFRTYLSPQHLPQLLHTHRPLPCLALEALIEHDDGTDGLPPCGGRDAHDGCVEDGSVGQREKRELESQGRDLLPAGLDDVY